MRTDLARTCLVIIAIGLAAFGELATPIRAQDELSTTPVALQEDPSSFTLSSGILTARVSKRSGDLTSLQYKGLEVLTDKSGHAGGYWSHDTTGGKETLTRVTIDPSSNGGNRAEVSVKGISGGVKMGHGPGAAAGGDFPADIEIRYSLGRGESGVYTYCTFTHQPEYPAASMTEARYCAKLADMFDWMTLDAKRSQHFPTSLREGDKYIHTTVQFEHPVYGWSSTTKNIGFWLINPSQEYMSGGPTKVEFLGHRDTTPVAAPCVLNYWRSSHYGGAVVSVAEGEPWTKVIGPFFLYVNSGSDPQALWHDAHSQSTRETAKWPFDWVSGIDYPRRAERATVRGQLLLADPQSPTAKTPNLLVGLTHPAYQPLVTRPGNFGPPRQVDWQTDAKHYQFWVRGDEEGNFSIPNVRPGKYTLHGFADGVLGEFAQADITVEPAQSLNLGQLTWTPLRKGKQLWQIGIPNRNGSEFFHGDHYADPAISLKYPALFPSDVNYVIGKSDFRQDWFFQHIPHTDDPNARVVPFGGIRGNGRATPYAISFDLPHAPHGQATLRLAICGTSTRAIEVSLNDQSIGQIDRLLTDGAIPRHSIQGLWYERELSFDAALMKPGQNTLRLIVPAGPINNGIIYDYVRLELDDPKPAPANNEPAKPDAATTAPPTIFIAGDSTAANGIPDAIGWGKHLGNFFDSTKLKVANHARGGRSSRTFITEGHWNRLVADLKAGDIVLIQFGHNDGAAINTERLARGSLPGLGDESQEIDNLVTKQHEVVHTFGWYLRQMLEDVESKGAKPILLSLTVRNIWKDGRVERGSGRYGQWSRELAQAKNVTFVDLTKIVADRYEQMGADVVKALFPRDHTHTSDAGAKLNAELVVAGLKGTREQSLLRGLSAAGRAAPTAEPGAVLLARPQRRGNDPAEFLRWLNLPEPGDPALPSLFLIGDSTVRNGRGTGIDGQFGWGDPLAAAFDPAKINLVNRAIGGTGARTFITQGHWDRVLAFVKPGDFVVMQFGHNDNGPRGPLRGIGEETEERTNPTTNQPETVHTFGWYLRKYIADTKAKGATPLVCSLVPRNIWREGKIARSSDGHAAWARAIAESEQTPFLDLHETIATRYDQLGEPAVTKLFADVRVHTNWEGAVLSADCVVASIKNLPQHPLDQFLVARSEQAQDTAAQATTPAPQTSAAPRSIADGPDPREIPVPPIASPLGKLPGPSQLPTRPEMPAVLTMNDGTQVTTPDQWKKRREELKRTLAYYAVGQAPPPPGNVTGREVKSELVADGRVKYRLIHLTFGPAEKLSLDIGLFTPTEGGPFPTVISPSGTPPGATPLPRLPNGPNQGRGQNVLLLVGPAPTADASAASSTPGTPGKNEKGGKGGFGGPVTAESIATRNSDLFRRGYALVTFNNNDCAEDTTLRNADGSFAFRNTRFYPAYPGYDWGILAGWAWGTSRIADYLETDSTIDKSKLIITGASRAGKAAMVAAAFDDRLMGAPVVTGGGGIGAYRFSGIGRGGKEGLGEMMNKYPNWFSPNLHEFWGQTDKLPFDAHWFLALCAPRPFIALEGDTDTVSLPNAVKQTILAAKPAYEFLGVPDRLGVNYAHHGHAFTQDDWNAMLDFADKHLRGLKIDRQFDQFLPEPPSDSLQSK